MTQREADVGEVERLTNQWSDEFLECRTYGHRWRARSATYNTRYRYFHVTQQCSECLSIRHSELSQRGHPFAPWIEYAEGYLAKGLGRIVGESRDVIRLATINRLFNLTQVKGRDAVNDLPHSGRTRREVGA